jgi:hypothetical protein
MRRAVSLVIAAVALGLSGASVNAQEGPGGAINPQRDCQVVRTCNFEKGGTYRGCLSSYTCRTCRFVQAKCQVGGRSSNCRELRCTWGG